MFSEGLVAVNVDGEEVNVGEEEITVVMVDEVWLCNNKISNISIMLLIIMIISIAV